MSATIARSPNFMLRRIVAIAVLALVLAAAAATVVHATAPSVQVHKLTDGTEQVHNYSGGAPLDPSGQQ